MIYPTLNIGQNSDLIINIYDTIIDNFEPIMSIDISGEEPDCFYTLLTLFLNQYNEGYENGWEDCLNNIDFDGLNNL